MMIEIGQPEGSDQIPHDIDEEEFHIPEGKLSFGEEGDSPFAALAALRDVLPEPEVEVVMEPEPVVVLEDPMITVQQEIDLIASRRIMVSEVEVALKVATALYDAPSRRAAVSHLEDRLHVVEPKPVFIMEEVFGGTNELMSSANFTLPVHIIEEVYGGVNEVILPHKFSLPIHVIDEVYGGTNEILSSDDFELPVVEHKNEVDLELEKIKAGYRDLGSEWMKARLKKQPISGKLINRSRELDQAAVHCPIEVIAEFMGAFAEGLGIDLSKDNESLSRDRQNYLYSLPRADSIHTLFNTVAGKRQMTPGFALFAKARLDLEPKEKFPQLCSFLLEEGRMERISKRLNAQPGDYKLSFQADPFAQRKTPDLSAMALKSPTVPVVCLAKFIPIHAEWLSQGSQPTE